MIKLYAGTGVAGIRPKSVRNVAFGAPGPTLDRCGAPGPASILELIEYSLLESRVR
jgi:hypothetical protein